MKPAACARTSPRLVPIQTPSVVIEADRPGQARRPSARACEAGAGECGGEAVAADTEVVLDGRLVGKPSDAADAARILRALAGRVHEVITGVAVVAADREEAAAVTSRVTMRDYDDAEIAAYVETGEPLDKAGAYGVQGVGGRLVSRVDGCLTNVIGLPTSTARRMLAAAGVVPRGAG